MTEDCIDCPEHYEGRAIDDSAWDGNAAMSKCANSDSPASCYRSICAGKRAGDPALQSSWALPHHKAPGDPANAAGVRNAMARLSQTQGLTNAGAARAHLEAHMAQMQSMMMRQIDPDQRSIDLDGKSIRLSSLVEACDEARERHIINWTFPFEAEILGARSSRGGFDVRGHAAVFGHRSLDLGGFHEQISPGFFQPVLDRDPDVHAVWDHDTRLTLARTRNKTLELREDDVGLYNFMKVAPTSYAADLRVLMERKDIDQQSFAFAVDEDRYEEDEEGNILRTLVRAADLFDVTITAQGAYPQTSADVSRSLRSFMGLDRKLFAVPKVGDGAAEEAIAVVKPADGAAQQSQAVSKTENTEAFVMWKEAMQNKAAARRITLAKLAEKLEKLE